MNLSERHLEDLRASGLTDDTIRAAGIYSETDPQRIAEILGWDGFPKSRGACMVIPFLKPDGSVNGFKRVKPDIPRKSKAGRILKYESPKGLPNRAYFPPGIGPVLADPLQRLLVTEGEKKALCAMQFGFPCTGLVGVFGWKLGKGVDELLPELDAIPWEGREVVIAYDSDLGEKKEVQEAENRLAAQLRMRGAVVKVARLPNLPDGRKCGLDDFLIHYSAEELETVLAVAQLAAEPEEDGRIDASKLDFLPVARQMIRDCFQHEDGPTLRFYQGEFFLWDGQRYQRLTDDEIRARVTQYIHRLACRITRAAVANIMACLAAETIVPSTMEMPCLLSGGDKYLIATENGLLDVESLLRGEEEAAYLLPHSPNWFSLVALPYAFDPEADCPKWKAFLSKNLEDDPDRIAILQEWFGLCLVRDTRFQRFLIHEGEGSNGKSVCNSALTGLVGTDNVSSVELEMFGERFQLSPTLGKLVNIASEIGETNRVAEGCLKAFTSGDRMLFDRKNREPVSMVPTARLVFSTNNRPRFTDRSNGLWRRLILMPWRVKIEDHEKIPGMDKVEWWAEQGELPGLFCWAIAGLYRLRQQGQFTRSAVCEQALDEYKIESNPARNFLTDHYADAPGHWVPAGDVYSEYSAWCKDSGYMPLSDASFGKEVGRAFPSSEKKRQRMTDGTRFYVYANIKKC